MTALIPHSLSDYQTKRYQFMVQVEESGNPKTSLYSDGGTTNILTIGVGFNVTDLNVLDKVLQLGFGLSDSNIGQFKAGKTYLGLRTDILAIVKGQHTPAQVAGVVTQLNAKLVEYTTTKTTFTFDSEAKIRSTFDELAKTYEANLDDFLSHSACPPMAQSSMERLALISMAYNNNPSAPYPLLSNNNALFTAIASGNRAAAWYEIRFNSSAANGRRYTESQIFGLYNDVSNVDSTEAQQVLDMYLAHGDTTMKTKETLSAINNANAYLNSIGLTNSQDNSKPLTAESNHQILKPISAFLIDHYIGENPLHISGKDFQFDGEVNLGLETGGSITFSNFESAYNNKADLLIAIDDTKNNTLDGGIGKDVLIGAKLNDTLDGGDDNDVLAGKEGNDTLLGGKGDDTLIGGDGNNTLYGNDDNDKIYGGKDDDFIIGGGGKDTIEGGLGKNEIYGGEGNDSITSESGEDHIYGDGGDDTITAKVSGAYLEGGSGNDTYIFTDNFGSQTVVDADGSIVVGGQTLGTFFKIQADGEYKIGNNFIAKEVGSSLLITASGSAIGTIVIQNWKKGNLGVYLSDVPSPPIPPAPPSDPLSIDLNANGTVDTVSITAGIHFDLDNNGFAERTSWVAPTDGMLVLDRNSNNKIDGGAELFGTETKISDGTFAKNGFIALAEFDLNKDGKIDNQDAVYTQLRVWKDANSNGITDTGELQTLTATNIASLNVTYTSNTTTDANNVQHREAGTFTRSDGGTGITNTLWFESDKQATIPVEELNGDGIALTQEIKALPNAKGFGNVYSLHQAMALDSSGQLQQKVQAFVNETDITTRKTLVNDILILWAGQPNTASNSRGVNVDAKQLGVLEKFWGQSAQQVNPTLRYAQDLNLVYQQLSNSIYTQMASYQQADVLSMVEFSNVSGLLTANFDNAAAYFVDLFNRNDTEAVFKLKDFVEVVKGIDPYNPLSKITVLGFSEALQLSAIAMPTALFLSMLSTMYSQPVGLNGTNNNDILRGTDAANFMEGLKGNDIIIGGKGNDALYGGDNSDIYVFARGDDKDVIMDSAGNDAIRFDTGIAENNVTTRRSSSDLVVTLDSGEEITVKKMFDFVTGSLVSAYAIENIQFANGNMWDLNRIKQEAVKGADGDDTINGFDTNDVITGGKGNDTLYGLAGNDTLNGGGLVDFLYGGDGNDIYLYSKGDGSDQIVDSSGIDEIWFDSSITPSQLLLRNSGDGFLHISFDKGADVVSVAMFDPNSTAIQSGAIEGIRFAEGTYWDQSRILQETLKPTVFNDFIYGYAGDDTLVGNGGIDTLRGGPGNDTYILNLGDVNELIVEDSSGQNDLVTFGAGISKSGLIVQKSYNDLVLSIPTGESIRIINGMDLGQSIESVYFTNDDTLTQEQLISMAADIYAATPQLTGTSGNDTLVSVNGYDNVAGGLGNDVYKVSAGKVVDTGGNDILTLTNSFTPQNIRVSGGGEWGDDHTYLALRSMDDYDQPLVWIDMWDYVINGTNPNSAIEQIQFANGTVWGINEIRAALLRSTSYTDQLYGSLANNDILQGGLGDDALSGGAGNDTYIYNWGDGNDFIGEATGVDKLVLNGIQDSQVIVQQQRFGWDDWDLLLTMNTGETIRINNQFGLFDNVHGDAMQLSEPQNIDVIQFANTVWDLERIKLEVLKGTEGNDTLYGFDTNDLINGGLGDDNISGGGGVDTLIGAVGNDTIFGAASNIQGGIGNDSLYGGEGSVFKFLAGDGQDIIYRAGVTDAIEFGAGITSSDITLTRTGDDLLIDIGHGDQILDKYVFSGAAKMVSVNHVLGSLRFSDSTTINVLQQLNGLGYKTTAPTVNNISFNAGGNVLSGTADGSYYMSLTDPFQNELGVVTSDAQTGSFSFTLSTALKNGEPLILTVSDEVGNNIVVNLNAPDLVAPIKPTASINTAGNIISGKAELGAFVVIKNATTNTVIATVTADKSTGAYALTLSTALLNKEKIEVTAKDLAGNLSPIVTIYAPDTTPPVAPTGIFDTTGKIITGVAEAGSTVDVKNSTNTTTLKSVTANATTGAYSITLTTALINKETVNVTAKDTAGNVSAVIAITAPDKTAPTQPTAAFDTTGKIITGVAEASGTVEVKNSANTASLGTVVANATTGAYSITLTTALINKETVNVTVKDAAGNFSVVAAIIAPDKTAPTQPTAAFDNTGKIITGVAEVGSTVEVKNSGNTASLGTVVANATTGAYSITLTTALTNKETVNITAKDTAGNISTVKSIIAPLVDTAPPAQPTAAFDAAGKVITGVAEAGSTVEVKNSSNTTSLGTVVANVTTGAYSITLTTALINKETVNVTAKDAAGNVSVVKAIVAPDKTAPTQPTAAFDTTGKIITGVAEAGSTVDVKNSGNTTSLGTVVANATTGAYSITLTTALISKETVNVTAKDTAGNISAAIAIVAPDKTAPTQPTAAFDAAGKVITGVAEAGSTVEVKNSGNTISLGTVVANATTGAYTITLTTALINKETVNVTAKDVAGNVSVLKAIIAPDKTAPAKPTAAFDTTGKIITGVAELGSTVVVKNAAATQIGTATANATTGAYTVTLATALKNKEVVSVTAKDAAGNISATTSATAPLIATAIAAPKTTKALSSSSAVQADAMIQAMASFAPPAASESRVLVGVYHDTHPMLVSQS